MKLPPATARPEPNLHDEEAHAVVCPLFYLGHAYTIHPTLLLLLLETTRNIITKLKVQSRINTNLSTVTPITYVHVVVVGCA